MTIKRLVALAALITIIQVRKVYQLQQRFKERCQELKKIALPTIQRSSTLQEQLDQYAKMHASQQFKEFKPNPDYSAQVLLKKSGKWNQSLYFTGKQLSNLLLEVTVVHKGDPHNHDKESVDVHLINTDTGEFLLSQRVKHAKLIKAQVESELYWLGVFYDWSKEEAEGEEISKHIAINIDIDPKIAPQVPSEKDQVIASQKLKGIKDQTDRIFMNSLQIWELIQSYHGDYFNHQEQVYLRAYVQLLLVFGINCIEWLMLRRTLKLKSLI